VSYLEEYLLAGQVGAIGIECDPHLGRFGNTEPRKESGSACYSWRAWDGEGGEGKNRREVVSVSIARLYCRSRVLERLLNDGIGRTLFVTPKDLDAKSSEDRDYPDGR